MLVGWLVFVYSVGHWTCSLDTVILADYFGWLLDWMTSMLGWTFFKVIRMLRQPKKKNGKRIRRRVRKVSSKRRSNQNRNNFPLLDFIKRRKSDHEIICTKMSIMSSEKWSSVVTDLSVFTIKEQIESGRSGRISNNKGENEIYLWKVIVNSFNKSFYQFYLSCNIG